MGNTSVKTQTQQCNVTREMLPLKNKHNSNVTREILPLKHKHNSNVTWEILPLKHKHNTSKIRPVVTGIKNQLRKLTLLNANYLASASSKFWTTVVLDSLSLAAPSVNVECFGLPHWTCAWRSEIPARSVSSFGPIPKAVFYGPRTQK